MKLVQILCVESIDNFVHILYTVHWQVVVTWQQYFLQLCHVGLYVFENIAEPLVGKNHKYAFSQLWKC